MKIKIIFSFILFILFVFFLSCQQKKSSDKEIINDNTEQFTTNKIEKPKGKRLLMKLVSNCDKGNYPDESLISKYKKKQAFDVIQTEEGRRIYIEFSFLDDCCTRHVAYAEISDTIKIKTQQIGDEVCECFCNYRYKLGLPKTAIRNKLILINDTKINELF